MGTGEESPPVIIGFKEMGFIFSNLCTTSQGNGV